MRLRRVKTQSEAAPSLPARAEAVTIVRPSGERVPARVAECDGDSLLVALMFRSEQPFQRGRLSGVELEFTSGRGRVRLRGVVTLEGSELLRFDELEPCEVIQEREYVRVPATRPVAVSAASGPGSVQTFSVDLSGGGMLLAGPGTLKVGERIGFRLTTAQGGAPIVGTGTVVRTDSQGRRAVCFDEISEGDHRRLVRYIFECQRAERRRGLEQGGRHG